MILLLMLAAAAPLAGYRVGSWWLDRQAARAAAEEAETDEVIRWIRDEPNAR